MFMRRALQACLPVLLAASTVAGAQDYPNRPVRIILPYPVGGHTDQVARAISQPLFEELKQPFIVDAKPGASTTIASAFVARSAPDGYTLYLANSCGLTQAPSFYPNVGYEPIQSFAVVGTVATAYTILAARPNLSANNLSELVALAKTQSGALTYGSSGHGGPVHIGTESLARRANIKLLHVPFAGTAPAVVALMGEQVDIMFVDTSGIQNVRGNKLKALAIAAPTRWQSLPNVPTVAEQGFPGFTLGCTDILLAPAGTPSSIVAKLSGALMKVLKRQDVIDYLNSIDSPVVSGTPEQGLAALTVEYEANTKIIRELGLSKTP